MTEPDPHDALRRIERKVNSIHAIVTLLVSFAFVAFVYQLYGQLGLSGPYAGIVAGIVGGISGAFYRWYTRRDG